jgi:hypothetical protein
MALEPAAFYFDESGEKGFVADNYDPHEFGLVAGIALPAAEVAGITAQLDPILSKVQLADGDKLHATDIFKGGANTKVRDEIYTFLLKHPGWVIIYEAVYAAGLFNRQSHNEELASTVRPLNPAVKLSGNNLRSRIYTELMEGIFIKLDEWCVNQGNSHIRLVTDRIDQGIAAELAALKAYLEEREHTHTVTGFDTRTKTVVSGTVTSCISNFDNRVKYLKRIEVETAPSTMTVVADLIANSLQYQLRMKIAANSDLRLHSHAALEGYPLADRVAFIDDGYLMDTLYAPPKKDTNGESESLGAESPAT